MRYLLDTHILLWWLNGDDNLSSQKKKIIEDANNIIYVSAVTIWEIEIKKALGKLTAPLITDELISDSQFLELPVMVKHIGYLSQLENYHADPFDRLLICQCLAEHTILLTEDKLIKQYPIKTA